MNRKRRESGSEIQARGKRRDAQRLQEAECPTLAQLSRGIVPGFYPMRVQACHTPRPRLHRCARRALDKVNNGFVNADVKSAALQCDGDRQLACGNVMRHDLTDGAGRYYVCAHRHVDSQTHPCANAHHSLSSHVPSVV